MIDQIALFQLPLTCYLHFKKIITCYLHLKKIKPRLLTANYPVALFPITINKGNMGQVQSEAIDQTEGEQSSPSSPDSSQHAASIESLIAGCFSTLILS